MCLLVVYRGGSYPDPAALTRATRRNPDGFGWAIMVGDEIITHRTLDPADGVASFVEYRDRFPDGPAIWHARFTTHGTSDLSNVHPFPVAGDPRVILAHNGVLPLNPTDGRSDTHAFAADLMRPEYLDDPAVMMWLGTWAKGSKLAILSTHPATRERFYIVNEHLGSWSDDEPGVWYSNESHAAFVDRGFTADPRSFVATGSTSYTPTDDRPSDTYVGRWDDPFIPATPDAWDQWQDDDPIIECAMCGEYWPGFVDGLCTCGTDLAHAYLVHDGDTWIESGSREPSMIGWES